MSLHYHGLPLTPFSALELLTGKNFCISFATARKPEVEWVKKHAQSVMWDNGAFTLHRTGKEMRPPEFYSWLEDKLGHPHWGVVPDVIGGTVEQQRELAATWPFDRFLGAPVWHLGLPIDYLLELSDEWPRVCFGSSAEYWSTHSPEWERRMDEAFEALAKRRRQMPWIHGLRMLSQLGKRWPLASADSVNVARNFKTARKCPNCMADAIDARQSSHTPLTQLPLWEVTAQP